MRAVRVGVVALLLAAVTTAPLAVNQPSLAIAVYALIPIVLAAFWFELRGALITAVAASLLYVGDGIVIPSPELSGSALWVSAANRSAVYFGVAVLVVLLLRRERRLLTRVKEQQELLEELESLRAALTPPEVPSRPQLEVATSFTPADGLVAGDFFLVSEGPMDSTTIVVGDVVGHGVDAARRAAYVRAALATFAKFSSDPVQLLQFGNAALAEQVGNNSQFVTAACVNIGAPPAVQLSWACAGHELPWYLDTAAPLRGGRVSAPLGITTDLPAIEAGTSLLTPGSGLIIFTDGLTEGRAARREPSKPVELFGEDRVREVIQAQRGAPPEQVVHALAAAVAEFAGGPLADDVCIVACRAAPTPHPTEPDNADRPVGGERDVRQPGSAPEARASINWQTQRPTRAPGWTPDSSTETARRSPANCLAVTQGRVGPSGGGRRRGPCPVPGTDVARHGPVVEGRSDEDRGTNGEEPGHGGDAGGRDSAALLGAGS